MNSVKYYLLLFIAINYSTSAFAQLGSRQYELLQKAVENYQKLQEKNDWLEITLQEKQSLKVHDQHPAVKEIKNRLSKLGDYSSLSHNEVFNPRLEDAVKRFQLRHGLEADGTINAAFLKELNTPPDVRIRQLQVNIDRLQKEAMETHTGTRIVANIPEYKLHVFENDREVLSMDVVVGKTTNPTAVFSDELKQVVFSPYWNIPPSIVKNEIMPAMKRNPRYLKLNNMEITGTKDGLPVIRQKPGPKNALGKVKFIFPNNYNIYFHDTPAKTLFAKNKRAFSHGCIRVSQPLELAKYVLKDQAEWTESAMVKAMNSGSEKWVSLKQAIPVSITYYTAWVDSSGDVHFRPDIYGHDKNMANAQ